MDLAGMLTYETISNLRKSSIDIGQDLYQEETPFEYLKLEV